jgi:hypothetical protein
MKPANFAWSYSALTAFETCPRRYYLTKVAKKVVEPQTEATIWGNTVHKALELRLTQRKPLPTGMDQWEPLVESIVGKGGKVEAEQKMGLDKRFMPTGFFSKDVWVRGITDVTVVKNDKAFIGDWKTGKPTPESSQLMLTAAMVMAHKPYVQKVVNAFIWLKTGGVTTQVFTRADIPTIWQEFMPRIQRLEIAYSENKFPPKPSGLCRKWCPVGKTLCEHCGE